MVPGIGHDAHQGESFHDAPSERRIDSASKNHGQRTHLDLPVGVANGICGRGAAAGDYMAESAQPKAHADFARERAHSATGNGEQTYLLSFAVEIKMVLLVGEILG